MKVVLESRMLLKTLHLIFVFCCGLCIVLVICSKKKVGKGKSVGKKGDKTSKTQKGKKTETEDDVKFDLNIKPAEPKRDEFDDDEENPLAKIPTKPRLPKQKGIGGTTTSRTTSTTGSKMEPEASFFAPNEKQTGASCYMVKTANKG